MSCCSNISKQIKINDFTQKQEFDIQFNLPEGKYVDKVNISIEGRIDDTVKLGGYRLVPWLVDTTFTHEWYSNDYKILFEPGNATDQFLLVDLEFVIL